jgi:arylsulfatase A-like enzyme
VPLIVKWPGVTPPGRVNELPTVTMDFYPTLLEAARLPARPAQHVDGVSLIPALRGEPQTRGPIFWHYPHYSNQGGPPHSAVRDGDWKLIEWHEDGSVELFNLRRDIGERNNLTEREPARAAELKRRLAAWRKETGARMPMPKAGTRLDAP